MCDKMQDDAMPKADIPPEPEQHNQMRSADAAQGRIMGTNPEVQPRSTTEVPTPVPKREQARIIHTVLSRVKTKKWSD